MPLNTIVGFNWSHLPLAAEFSTTLQPGSFAVVSDTGIAPEHVFRVPMGTRTRMFMRILVTRQ